jgi:hypothetical protein
MRAPPDPQPELQAVNAALYSGMATSTPTPTVCDMPYADARVMRQLS